jgi:hypothetical protein
VLACALLLLLGTQLHHAAVSPGERQALVDLYLSTNGTYWVPAPPGPAIVGWSNHTNSSVDPCVPSSSTWTGVTCASSPDRIVYVHNAHL